MSRVSLVISPRLSNGILSSRRGARKGLRLILMAGHYFHRHQKPYLRINTGVTEEYPVTSASPVLKIHSRTRTYLHFTLYDPPSRWERSLGPLPASENEELQLRRSPPRVALRPVPPPSPVSKGYGPTGTNLSLTSRYPPKTPPARFNTATPQYAFERRSPEHHGEQKKSRSNSFVPRTRQSASSKLLWRTN